ncbi:MAG: hypothetical protein ABR599_12660 [Gemmatimonadota bacterium]
MRPLPRTGGGRAGALVIGALLTLAACRKPEPPPSFASFFELESTLRVAPIESFDQIPASILTLPDGRYLLPETEGVWIHVVGARGEGLTRLGGRSPAPLGSGPSALGRFLSLSDVALREDGRIVASDRTSPVLTVFGPALEVEATVELRETRSVWQLEAVPGTGLAAAVSPRHPTAGGQVLVIRSDDSLRSYLEPDPVFLANRWTPVSSTRIESLPDGRMLAYWAPLPWATVFSLPGGGTARVGKPSRRYKAPVTGPRVGAPLEALAEWYSAFTPLAVVESVDSLLVFQFLGLPAAGDSARADARGGASDPPEGRRAFVNLHDLSGERIAADLLLPPGAGILKSNDRSRVYLLRTAAPRELQIELWRPKPPTSAGRPRRVTRSARRGWRPAAPPAVR